MSDELGDRIANRLGEIFLEAGRQMKRQDHTRWNLDEVNDDESVICYFFDRNYSGGASITLDHDGSLVFEGYNHTVVIKNIGCRKEQVVIKNAADLVV